MRFLVWGALLVWGGSLGAQTLQDLGSATGAQVLWEPYRDLVVVSDDAHRLVVDLATGRALGDGFQSFDLKVDPVSTRLAPTDYDTLVTWWKAPRPKLTDIPAPVAPITTPGGSTGPRIQVLVLDAGHGGSDPGSIGRHTLDGKEVVLREKDLTLAVVLELQKMLTQAYPDRAIVLTRGGDTYPTLEKRVQIAHAQKLSDSQSIFFLSVHFNASLNRRAQGLEFWYIPQDFEREVLADRAIPDSVFPVLNTLVDSEYKKQSRDLAVSLAKGMAQELGDQNIQRGLKENPWFVVRMARMPAVLAELGFITNPDEARMMQDEQYLKKLARGLYTGLVSFIQSYEDRR